MANPLYGQNKLDNSVDAYDEYLDFCGMFQGNLTATGITATDAIMIAALAEGSAADILAGTLVANAVNYMADDHASAANCVFLPDAAKGTHLACDYSNSPDGHASVHGFKCNGAAGARSAVFAKQVVGYSVETDKDTHVETGGTNLIPTSVVLNYLPAAATTNTLGVGSQIHFYCPKDGQWLVKMALYNLGTGATGVWQVA
tara:strand:+ start:61 stop:663 length:603 start_codon:yes stop_codon:yes gene_type:complete